MAAGVLTIAAAIAAAFPSAAAAQEPPYFVTYSHHLEEPGSLELEFNPLLATQRGAGGFAAAAVELEYGVRGWWTSEVYLDGQATRGDSAVLTGWRWENRVRLLMDEHAINPVLYIEYEDVTAADKTMLEVVGHDVEADHADANASAQRERLHELETKLILSGEVRDWNVAVNLIAEKNLTSAPWEFGYAVATSRPLALAARPEACAFCPENFSAGVELYGGLGDQHVLSLAQTSHYVAPVVAWNGPSGWTVRLSPGFGLNRDSHRFLLRFGVAYEFQGQAAPRLRTHREVP